MGNRSEFHGSVGQVVVGNLHTAPRSSNVVDLGRKGGQGKGSASEPHGDCGGCAEQAVIVRQSRWTLALQLLTAGLLLGAMWVMQSRQLATDDGQYCLHVGKQHSVGSVVQMAETINRQCVKEGGNSPQWASLHI